MPELRPFLAVVTMAALSISLACQPSSRPDRPGSAVGESAQLSAADQDGIRAADLAFAAAANAGNVDGVVAIYAEEAYLLPPGLPPIKGKSGIREFWGGLLGTYNVRLEISSEMIEGRGDLAYNVGHYQLEAKPKAKGPPPIAEEGKFVEVLKRQADGSWKYAVDMYSPNSAPKKP